jgi:hypothetical protein
MARLNVASDFGGNIQAAFDALAGSGGELYFPAGAYTISSPIVQTSGNVRIVGDSPQNSGSVLKTFSAIAMFDIRGGSLAVERVLVQGFAGSTGFQIGTVDYPQFRDVNFVGGDIGISLSYGHGLLVDHCWFLNQSTAIFGSNTTTPDMGDHVISNSQFVNSPKTGSAINFVSSGGLKIANNKFIGWSTPINIAPADGVDTSDTIINGNSIEGYGATAIQAAAAGAGSWRRFNITGNQLAGSGTGGQAQIVLGKGVSIANINGNIIEGDHAAGIGIQTSGQFWGGIIEGNTFLDVYQAIKDQSNGSNLVIGRNYYRNNPVIYEGCYDNAASHVERDLTVRTSLLGLVNSTTRVNFYRIDIPAYQSARVDLLLNGIVQGAGYFAFRSSHFFANNGRGIERVELFPRSVAGAFVDVFLDTSGDSYVVIGVGMHSGVGTEVNGALEVNIRGVVQKLTKLV